MAPPEQDCPLCPRLQAFRDDNRARFPAWHNAPVPSFGSLKGRLLIIGLAPGLRGANQTGRPFTGDFAGDLLFKTLIETGLAIGTYGRVAGDGLALVDCRITNAVRCVPPLNRPTPAEIRTCGRFLREEIAALPNLRVCLALGRTAHDAVLTARDQRPRDAAFAHGAVHALPHGLHLVDSYHCSRQNTNTGRLTPEMFRTAVATAKTLAAAPA